jgi:hypothetical protein
MEALMATYCKPPDELLVVVLERDGEEVIRTEAANGDKAMLQAVILLLAAKTLRAGDRITVEAVTDR